MPSGKESAVPPTGSAANPYLSAAKYGITHIDSAQSDSFDDPIPRGTFHLDPTQLARVPGGPVNIITLASTDPNYRWVSSSSGVRYVDVSNGGFKQVAALDAPGVQPISTQQLDAVLNQRFTEVGQIEAAIGDHWAGANWQRIANGVYSLVDRDNFVYYVTQQSEIIKFALKNAERPEDGITIASRIDFKPYLTGNITSLGIPENIVGTSMTYDGHLLVLSTGSLSVIDRDLSAPLQQIKFGDGETVSNSMAVDEHNGIYVASDKLMRKIVWTGSQLSQDEADGAWWSAYDTGRQPPTIKFGSGTGSTPTLMGYTKDDDELVVITDGSDHMKLVAFWRNTIPEGFQQKPGTKSNRIADQIDVTAGLPDPLPEFIQSEQSVVVSGRGAFVVNNIGAGGTPDRLVDVLANGPVSPPPHGVQRFEWDPAAHRWTSAWTRGDVVSTSMVPAVSTTSGIVFLNGYTKTDGWEVTGLNWQTGETVHRTIFGQSNLGNGAYALIEGLPNGDLLFNSVGGPLRATIAK
ncbi:hypothetical protein [[Mycobacterium] holstebronense]|uniref:Uncharacterized protein n=1 Tax=[Mycobacterium] holstebronense TaxID=3064288 RepID=A0ABM9LHC0_9MYCO|nr:hypothetical protein [Mycolicibacter sp. MU0102]CAJ1499043.1 hypothetical protein MU0102_000875 [Mycolicibacter sp. MU0102]